MKSAATLILTILALMAARAEAAGPPVTLLSPGDETALDFPPGAPASSTAETDPTATAVEDGEPEGPAAPDQTMEKSPLLSMLRSTAIPGWGQIYTGHPYRGGLFFALEGFLFTFAWAENDRANRNWDSYQATEESRYLDAYDRHFGRGRDLVSYGLAVFLINIADAYVGAHLYDFDSKVSFDEDQKLDLSMEWRF